MFGQIPHDHKVQIKKKTTLIRPDPREVTVLLSSSHAKPNGPLGSSAKTKLQQQECQRGPLWVLVSRQQQQYDSGRTPLGLGSTKQATTTDPETSRVSAMLKPSTKPPKKIIKQEVLPQIRTPKQSTRIPNAFLSTKILFPTLFSQTHLIFSLKLHETRKRDENRDL